MGRVMRVVRAPATDHAAKRPYIIALQACEEYSSCFNSQLLTVKYPTFESLSKTN